MKPTWTQRLAVMGVVLGLGGGALGQVPLNRSPLQSVTSPGSGVADEAEPWAVTLNPASLRGLSGFSLGLRHSELTDDIRWSGRGTGLYAAMPLPLLRALKVGAAVELLRSHDVDMLGKLTLGLAYSPVWWASIGLSYGHSLGSNTNQSYYGGLSTVGLGVNLRPSRRLALGLMVHDLNQPQPEPLRQSVPAITRTYELEALLQPLGDSRWDVGLGVRVGEATSEVSPRVRMWIRPVRGLGFGLEGSSVLMKGSVEPVAWRASVGLSVDFARVGASVFQHMGLGLLRPVGYHGGSVAVRFSQERYPSLWAGPKSVLRVHLGEYSGRDQLRLLLSLRELAEARHIEGVLVVVSNVSGGWGQAFELRQALTTLRKSGKRVVAYAADLGTREYYIASAADEILLDPAGLVRLSGIVQTTTHVREALERLGVKVDLLRVGQFKASPESFTRDGPTEPARSQRQSLVDDLSQRVVTEIAQSRRLSVAEVEAQLARGQHLPQLAKSVGLVDAITEQDAVEERLRALFGPNLRISSLPVPERSRSARPSGVAVVEVTGDLTEGRSLTVPYLDFQTIGAQTLSAALDQVASDARVEAVVLRIDSPGGSALAADMLARQVKQLRQRKPVVCSFGDLAASGGYYLAAPCQEIFADPLTVTGSIGIYGGKVDVSALLGKLAVERARYVHGEHADMTTPFRPYSDEERALVQEQLQAGYDRFLEVVGSGRQLTRKELEPLAEGRVFSGGQAAARRLVDKLGGLADAVARARELAELSSEKEQAVFFYPQRSRSLVGELLDVASGLVTEPLLSSSSPLPAPLQDLLRLIPSSVWAIVYDGRSVLARIEEDPVSR
jgi:protease-4